MHVHVIASPSNWIEGEAVAQLEKTATLPGMTRAVGMPDLHPGKGSPIGAAFASQGRFYPHLVGSDIGCGMALWRTELPRAKAKLDKWVRKLTNMEGPWDGDLAGFSARQGLQTTPFDASLGTIGAGNHFAELQAVETVFDAAAAEAVGLRGDRLHLLVHSGSRGFGEHILRAHVARFGAQGVAEDEPEATAYMALHAQAVTWAKANRTLIAQRFLEALNTQAVPLLDVCHNCVKQASFENGPCWLHRKGAAPSDEGPVIIPGSRGTLSYLVRATGDQQVNLATLAHGAGRKWRRGEARARLSERFSPASLTQTALGGRIICEDKELLYEEAPQAYKDVDIVVDDMVQAGLVEVIATLRPLLTYKTRGGRE